MSSAADTTAADIIVLTETWLSESVQNAELFFTERQYSVFRCDRSSRRGGGVLIAVADNLECFRIDFVTSLEFICIHITVDYQKLIFCVCYRSPSAPAGFCNALHDALHAVRAKFTNAPIFLFGDFNFPGIDWSSATISTDVTLSESSQFCTLCSEFSLTQVVTQPTRLTRTTSSVLDLLLTDAPDLVSTINYMEGISDHRLLHITLNLPARTSRNKRKIIFNYGKANFTAINEGLAKFLDEFVIGFELRSVNTNWCMFRNKIQELIDLHIPRKNITTNHRHPWYNQTLKRMANKKKRIFRKAKSSGKPEHWSELKEIVSKYKTAIKQAKYNFFNSTLPSMLTNNPKAFWSIVNDHEQSEISLFDPQSNTIPKRDCANVLNQTFATTFSDVSVSPYPDYNCFVRFPMDAVMIDYAGIVAIIKRLKLSSSCGPDNINTKVLKNTAVYSSIILSKIFEQSLLHGILPEDWKVGKVVPLHKSGDKHSPSNYRPISLTSVCCKIMEHVIYSQLVNFLESSSFFTHSQHGFRKLYSCETQLLMLTDDVHSVLDRGSEVDCVYLDFCKAFDKVPHNLLLLKLSRLNIDPNVLTWIKSFLTDRSQFVHANGFNSSSIPVTSGVPQGSVLGPLLFLIYINDLPSNLTSTVKLFADDCAVYREIKNVNDNVLLQADLDAISDWCSKWKMTLNTNKCKLMHFSRRKITDYASYTLNDTLLETVTSYKYLGVLLTSDLTWNSHVSRVIADANRMLGYIKRNFYMTSPSVKTLLYKSLIRSKLEYAVSIWDPRTKALTNAIEAIQNRAARFILSNYHRTASVTLMKQSLSLIPLELRRKISRLCLFFKIYHMNSYLRNALFTPATYVSSRMDHRHKVGTPFCRSASYLSSFIPKTSSEWNHLPAAVVETNSLEDFKKRLRAHFGVQAAD